MNYKDDVNCLEREMADDLKPLDITEGRQNTNSSSSSSPQSKDNMCIEKAQEEKLKEKFPEAKSGRSAFLQKRMAKGRIYFDSGEYAMSKSKMENRTSKQIHSKKPTLIPRTESVDEEQTSVNKSSGNDAEKEVHRDLVREEYGDKDHPLPEPQETAQQAIPTPELLFLRRASLHMPKASNELPATSPKGNRRRQTAAPKGLIPMAESSAFPDVFGGDEAVSQELLSQQKSTRRATLHVPSKLVM